MKPVYLEFSGINSFKEKATIDFRRLLSGGIFGIFGDTGSGKSTILDAIHLAIYNRIERASGSIADCINHHSEKAVVIFDFEIVNEGVRHTYRVHRERGRKQGSVKAYLYRLESDGAYAAIAEGTNEVNAALEKIVGLTFDDFKKCIALPQGEFAGLVNADTKDRIKLISRLFGLEKYGENLRKRVFERCAETVQAEKLLVAKMEENEGGRVEIIEECAGEVAAYKTRRTELETEIKAVKERLETLKKQQAEKREYDDLTNALSALEKDRAAYERKRSRFEKAAGASRVKEKAESLEKTKIALDKARLLAAKAEKDTGDASAELARLQERLENMRYDEKIETANKTLAEAEVAERELKKAEEKLAGYRKEYRAVKDKYPADDYDGKIAAVEQALADLDGDVTYAEFLKENLKDVLLAETYGEFRFDLSRIEEAFPVTEQLIATLKEKYTLAPSGSDRSFDIAAIKQRFDEIKNKAAELKKKKVFLENAKRDYERNELEKERIKANGTAAAEETEKWRKILEELGEDGTVSALKAKITRLKDEKKQDENGVKAAQDKHGASVAESAKQRALEESLALQETEQIAALEEALRFENFSSPEEAAALLQEIGDLSRAKAEFENFFTRYETVKSQLAKLSVKNFEGFSETELTETTEKTNALEQERLDIVGKLSVAEERLSRLKDLREKYLDLEKQRKQLEKERVLWEQLRSLTAQNKFMEFIASEYLQDICVDASNRLLKITSGRYFLRYDTEFMVGDNFDGGNLRPVRTLSGGETFLVSLSLALSLSNAIFSRSLRPAEFFFLDEGFGTLDGKLVDTVMDVLGKLSKNFAVGLISHVEELKTRIENKILVTAATETHGSTIKTETYA